MYEQNYIVLTAMLAFIIIASGALYEYDLSSILFWIFMVVPLCIIFGIGGFITSKQTQSLKKGAFGGGGIALISYFVVFFINLIQYEIQYYRPHPAMATDLPGLRIDSSTSPILISILLLYVLWGALFGTLGAWVRKLKQT